MAHDIQCKLLLFVEWNARGNVQPCYKQNIQHDSSQGVVPSYAVIYYTIPTQLNGVFTTTAVQEYH